MMDILRTAGNVACNCQEALVFSALTPFWKARSFVVVCALSGVVLY